MKKQWKWSAGSTANRTDWKGDLGTSEGTTERKVMAGCESLLQRQQYGFVCCIEMSAQCSAHIWLCC